MFAQGPALYNAGIWLLVLVVGSDEESGGRWRVAKVRHILQVRQAQGAWNGHNPLSPQLGRSCSGLEGLLPFGSERSIENNEE
jgi:hypothetical protein